jgi:hypothetical protein
LYALVKIACHNDMFLHCIDFHLYLALVFDILF